MAYDDATADRVRAVLGCRRVVERKMFEGLAFVYRGHMVCGVLDDRVVLRLGNEGADEALGMPGVSEMDFTGKPMRSMAYLEPQEIETEEDLKAWVEKGIAFAKTLEAKE